LLNRRIAGKDKEVVMYMVMFVLNDPQKLVEVLNAWEKAGITGVTIIESTGMHRVRRSFLPMRYTTAIFNQEENHLTLFALVGKKELVDASLMASESVVGSLDNGNTGIFTAWPVEMVKGLEKRAN
jgi:nitrogen regulatory protein PII